MGMINAHPIPFAIAFLICLWVVIFTMISQLGGWASLAGRYRESDTYSGPRWKMQSGQMRWFTNYNNCLTLGANATGLYLGILFICRIGHPPLFIPWREIAVSRKKILWTNFVELRLGHETDIPFRIGTGLAEKLKAAAGTSWPSESTGT
jgi:hypothetical protein